MASIIVRTIGLYGKGFHKSSSINRGLGTDRYGNSYDDGGGFVFGCRYGDSDSYGSGRGYADNEVDEEIQK